MSPRLLDGVVSLDDIDSSPEALRRVACRAGRSRRANVLRSVPREAAS